jgi:hypothetical protein
MSSGESTGDSIKRRLRSSGEAFAEHTLETAKNAAKGLENTHAAYIYPLQVISTSVEMTDHRESTTFSRILDFLNLSFQRW